MTNQYALKAMNVLEVSPKALAILNLIGHLVKTEDDYKQLIAGVISKGRHKLFEALLHIQRQKRQKLDFSKEEWVDLYCIDMLDAMQSLFQQKINPRLLKVFDNIHPEVIWEAARKGKTFAETYCEVKLFGNDK